MPAHLIPVIFPALAGGTFIEWLECCNQTSSPFNCRSVFLLQRSSDGGGQRSPSAPERLRAPSTCQPAGFSLDSSVGSLNRIPALDVPVSLTLTSDQMGLFYSTLGHPPNRPTAEHLYIVPDPTSASGMLLNLVFCVCRFSIHQAVEPEDDFHDTTAGVKVWAQTTPLLSSGSNT